MSIAMPVLRGLSRAAPLVLGPHLRRRARAGKEDGGRLTERRGIASRDRPPGPLVWLHAASVGESLSGLPVVGALRERHGCAVLVTTGTVTSARLVAERMPEAIHQFAPLDALPWVRAFLDHWRPSLGLWVESELWPVTLGEARARGIPLALVNARLSVRSARRWRLAPGLARTMLGAFDVAAAATEEGAGRLAGLGASNVVVTGDLKASRPADAPDPAALAALRAALGERPRWLAASTHPGEEEAVAAAHEALAARAPDLVSLLVPRHPERGDEVAAMLSARGLEVTRRSRGEAPQPGIHLGDTLGEMPLWGAVTTLAYLGAGWGELGGHNPLELAQARTLVLSGPKVANAADAFARLEGCVRYVEDADALTAALLSLTDDEGRPSPEAEALAARAAEAAAPDPGPLDRTLEALAPLTGRALA